MHAAHASLADLDALVPEAADLVTMYARFQQRCFEFLADGLAEVDDPAAIDSYAVIAQTFSDRFERLRDEFPDLLRADASETVALDAPVDEFWSRLRPTFWTQRLLTALLVSGICDDAVLMFCQSLKGPGRQRLRTIATVHPADDPVAVLLSGQMQRDERLRDLLSLWGRRLFGDAMLLVRALFELPPAVAEALSTGELPHDSEVGRQIAVVETVRGELLSMHTKRMDALGLAS